MNKIFFFASAFMIFISCKQEAKKQFEITGSIKNSNDRIVYLEETPLASSQRIVADSSVIASDGSYRLKSNASEESLFSLFLKSQTYPLASVVNDASKLVVNVDMKDAGNYEVKGSSASQSMKDFSISAFEIRTRLYWLGIRLDSLKKANAPDSSIIEINSLGEAQLKELQGFVSGYVNHSTDPVAGAWALGSYSDVFSMDEYQELLQSLVLKYPNHKGIAALKELNDRQIIAAKQREEESTSPDWTNKQAPELQLPDLNGKEIKLSSFRGKYLLVDFWASWCMPCRHENPNVVAAYNKFKGKNFTILGVSLDREKSDWVDAIQKDGLSWTQVSDLREWKSVAVSTFNFSEIPFNLLIDPNGKVIGQSLRGEALDQKLQEVLQ